MKQIIEIYITIWSFMLLMMLCISFTMINMHVIQARRIFSNIKTEVQASNGSFVPVTGNKNTEIYSVDTRNGNVITLANNGYYFTYDVQRLNLVDSDASLNDETYIYNSLYQVNLKYYYSVPLFGRQCYPLNGYVY